MANQKRDWKFIAAVMFWSIFVLSAVGYTMYKRFEKEESVELYTVCTITGRYVTAKDEGARFEYPVNGKVIQSFCTGQQCIDLEIGSRYVIKYWDRHPDWFEILFDKPIPSDVTPPLDGWREAPKF